MYEKRNKRKQFLFPESLIQKMESICNDKGISQNELVNKSVESYLKRFKHEDKNNNKWNETNSKSY